MSVSVERMYVFVCVSVCVCVCVCACGPWASEEAKVMDWGSTPYSTGHDSMRVIVVVCKLSVWSL